MAIYGLSEDGAQVALEAVLTAGTIYAGLLETLPSDRAGTGLVECTDADYDRIEVTAWLNDTEANGDSVRYNDGTVTFVALDASASIVGWGIWDAVTAGTLLAFGPLVDSDDNEIARDFVAGDVPRFADQELRIRLGAG